MNRKRFVLLLTTFLLVFSVASETVADISNAAVLYLRIAAGARAAGMGEGDRRENFL